MRDLIATISRQMYVIPGAYYITEMLSKVFSDNEPSVRIVQTPFHFKMKVDTSKYLGKKIYWRGAHDWSTILAMKKEIKDNDIVLDIGANIGEYALYAASMIQKNGKVFAFEPVQRMYHVLTENIQLNPHLKDKIITIKKGVGNKKTILPIFDEIDTNNEGLYSLYANNFKHSETIENIEIDTLDNIIAEYSIPQINFIKIDVEGYELFVLQGAEKTIHRFRPKLMIEVSEKNYTAAGYSAFDVMSYLHQRDYGIFLILKRGRLKRIHSPQQLPDFCNILAIPSQ